MTIVNKPKRFLLQQLKFVSSFLLLISMLIDNNKNVALLNYYKKFVEHQMGE